PARPFKVEVRATEHRDVDAVLPGSGPEQGGGDLSPGTCDEYSHPPGPPALSEPRSRLGNSPMLPNQVAHGEAETRAVQALGWPTLSGGFGDCGAKMTDEFAIAQHSHG